MGTLLVVTMSSMLGTMQLLSIILLFEYSFAQKTHDCPDGWVLASTLGCFGFFHDNANISWFEAQAVCSQNGGYLAEPKTVEQMNFLSGVASLEEAFTGIQSWWINLSDFANEGAWSWGRSLEAPNNTFWSQDSPSYETNNILDCALIYHNAGTFEWHDSDCGVVSSVSQNNQIGSLCQKDITESTTTTEPSLTTTLHSGCPDGWQGFDGSCYIHSNISMPRRKAQEACETIKEGANLVSILSSSEQYFLHQLAFGKELGEIWLGGTDIASEGSWVWDDGSEWEYTNWQQGEGYGGKVENCMILFSYYNTWYDTSCSEPLPYICKF